MGIIAVKNKRVLVTGGNGYLGSFLVKELRNLGANVFIMDRNKSDNFQTITADITDYEAVKNAVEISKPQFVFHLAATLNRDRNFEAHDSVMECNYQGTLNVLNALKDIPYENFIFSSSSEIYGNNIAPFNESQIPNPVSPYSLSKTNAEFLIQTFSELNSKNYTILRIFNFYGENMPEAFFIPQMMNTLKNNLPFNMTNGEQTRDFLYVADVVQGLLHATKAEAINQIMNVCSGKGITLKELVTTFATTIKSKSNINFGALPYRENEIWNMVGDNNKIKSKLNFEPKYNLFEGINEVIANSKA